jgi:transposase-like protein
VLRHSTRAELEPNVVGATQPGTEVYTDEGGAYDRLPEQGRPHRAVCHAPGRRAWARDDNGEGVREMHTNTLEGIGTGLRNFLRPFRGVSKHYLQQYVSVFQWTYELSVATATFLSAMFGGFTEFAT